MRYIVGVLVVVVMLLFFITFAVGPKDKKSKTAPKPIDLMSYVDKDSSVSLITYGTLVGDDQRRAIKVTVTPYERRFEVLDGYEKNVGDIQTYQNNKEAYANFLSGLATAGFVKSKETNIKDPRGVCPMGNRFGYILIEGSTEKQNLWSVSCSSGVGSFAGQTTVTQQLFRNQITDYDTLVSGIRL